MLRRVFLDEQERRADVDVQMRVDVVGGQLVERAEPAQRVVRDEDVDMAERSRGGCS